MKNRLALTKKQFFSDGSILVATGLGISTDLKPFRERSGPHGSRRPCSTALGERISPLCLPTRARGLSPSSGRLGFPRPGPGAPPQAPTGLDGRKPASATTC